MQLVTGSNILFFNNLVFVEACFVYCSSVTYSFQRSTYMELILLKLPMVFVLVPTPMYPSLWHGLWEWEINGVCVLVLLVHSVWNQIQQYCWIEKADMIIYSWNWFFVEGISFLWTGSEVEIWTSWSISKLFEFDIVCLIK